MKTLNGCEQSPRHKVCQWQYLFAASAILGLPSTSWALGVRVPNQDAEATARGNAFVATANNPSAIYYNPAGITQLPGLNAQLGGHVISINSTYKSPSGTEANSQFEVQGVICKCC